MCSPMQPSRPTSVRQCIVQHVCLPPHLTSTPKYLITGNWVGLFCPLIHNTANTCRPDGKLVGSLDKWPVISPCLAGFFRPYLDKPWGEVKIPNTGVMYWQCKVSTHAHLLISYRGFVFFMPPMAVLEVVGTVHVTCWRYLPRGQTYIWYWETHLATEQWSLISEMHAVGESFKPWSLEPTSFTTGVHDPKGNSPSCHENFARVQGTKVK